ncbi:chemotaxis protein CheD [Romboutsia lituseburensis]|uniref:Probable chemoreceptor glutamine deamidase CheD n=1 Tax=Romboutsia lituseburensis DSM 797 TaxID=1121325 RepID=A0A1G9PDV7_9FIRM|nr:chemotaxis protein CheD [Romboutsia lituseburensis]CEH33338.1 Chemoreceptor glutamine deamidase CheD [Romboutsia lituseburensis]SDL96733.1 chemotaxis protein CheD [Romboutsia lituseburensis DSM 797]
MENVIVGIADFKIVKAPNQIMTVGLGSCCGVVLYDETSKIAGLVHVLLSDSKFEKNVVNKAKYADSGINLLYQEMIRAGANTRFIRAKLAGGAHMFNFKNTGNSIFTIGERNVKACKETLAKLKISIVSEDVLGTCGRTIVFDTTTSKLRIKSVGKSDKYI